MERQSSSSTAELSVSQKQSIGTLGEYMAHKQMEENKAKTQTRPKVIEPEILTIRTTITLGFVLRKRMITAIRQFCDYYRIRYTLQEYNNSLTSDYLFEATGESNYIYALKNWLESLSQT